MTPTMRKRMEELAEKQATDLRYNTVSWNQMDTFKQGFLAAHALMESREKVLVEEHREFMKDMWTSFTAIDLTLDQWQLVEVKDASTKWALQQALRYIGMKVNQELEKGKQIFATLDSKQVDENESGEGL